MHSRSTLLIVYSLLAIAIGLVLRIMAEDWATLEFTTPAGEKSGEVNHSKKFAFEFVSHVLNYGGAGLLAYALYLRFFGQRQRLRVRNW